MPDTSTSPSPADPRAGPSHAAKVLLIFQIADGTAQVQVPIDAGAACTLLPKPVRLFNASGQGKAAEPISQINR